MAEYITCISLVERGASVLQKIITSRFLVLPKPNQESFKFLTVCLSSLSDWLLDHNCGLLILESQQQNVQQNTELLITGGPSKNTVISLS